VVTVFASAGLFVLMWAEFLAAALHHRGESLSCVADLRLHSGHIANAKRSNI